MNALEEQSPMLRELVLQAYRAGVEYELAAIKNLIWINGGALAVLTAFADYLHLTPKEIILSAIFFAFGLALTVSAAINSHHSANKSSVSFFALFTKNLSAMDKDDVQNETDEVKNAIQEFFTKVDDEQKKGQFHTFLANTSLALSALSFVIGSGILICVAN